MTTPFALPRSAVASIWRFALALLVLLAVDSARGEVEDTIPKTRNSPLVAIPERAKLDPQSGGATYVYSIEVPPGTGGATPNLKLTGIADVGSYRWNFRRSHEGHPRHGSDGNRRPRSNWNRRRSSRADNHREG